VDLPCQRGLRLRKPLLLAPRTEAVGRNCSRLPGHGYDRFFLNLQRTCSHVGALEGASFMARSSGKEAMDMLGFRKAPMVVLLANC